MGNLEIEAKTDREILILTVEKINAIDEKIDSICGNVASHDDEINKLETSTSLLKEKVDTQKKITNGIVGAIITFVTGLILSWMAHR